MYNAASAAKDFEACERTRSEKKMNTEPNRGAASSNMNHQAHNNTATATPASTGARNYKNVKKNPIVTVEKSTSVQSNNHNADGNVICSTVTCPDGSILELSPASPSILLGPGKHGIPSTAPDCRYFVNLVKNPAGDGYSTELVPIGLQSCRVTRAGNTFFVKSLYQQILTDASFASPTRIIIMDGDIIEPYHQDCSAEEATAKGAYYPFKVNLSSSSSAAAAAPGPKNGMIGQTYVSSTTLQQRNNEQPVMDGSAFLEASRKIDEAAKYSCKTSGDNEVKRVHFDNESFTETFLEDPTNTTNFFISYYKSVVKRVSDKSVLDNLLSTYADAISPLGNGNEKRNVPMNIKGVDDFPLKELLSIFITGNQLSFGKRMIEGYIWLSCQDILTKKEHLQTQYSYFCQRTVASGPKLLVSVYDPLVNLCNTLGWDKLEDLLVGSVEKLCECGHVSMALDFCQNIASKSTPSGREVAHRPQVCARMFKVAYGGRFHADPSLATREFIDYSVKDIVPTKSSKEFCRVLLGSFVDIMSPPNPENRRIPLRPIYNLPLKDLLSHIVERECYTLGKRVIDGYIWLSCQEILEACSYSDRIHSPSGPMKLKFAGKPLQSICDALGWNELEVVLVEAVKKLCTHGTWQEALELCQIASNPSERSSGEDGERFRVRSLMMKALYTTTIARFQHNPTETANFVIYWAKKTSEPSTSRLITDFVDMMSPVDHSHRQMPLQTVKWFPLKEILSLLVEGKKFALGKRVIEGYIWLSCQEVRVTRYYGMRSRGHLEVSKPGGPKLLVNAFEPLVGLCNVLGWNELEDLLVESIQKLFQFGNPHFGSYEYMETAIDLIKKIHPAPVGDSDCSRVCAKMATIACDETFKGLEVIHKKNHFRYLLPLYTKLVRLIANFCPAMATGFETMVKNFDVDQMLYPLLSDESFRSNASVNDVAKNMLRQLTTHCAQLLHARLSSDPDVVTAWTVPNAHVCQNAKFRQFLLTQCKETFDWEVRKSDHESLLHGLQALIDAGDISCKSHKPYSKYHFKITKLKTCRVHVNALTCSCSSDVDEKKITQKPTGCLQETTKVKRARDEEMLQSLKAYLTPEEIRGLSSQKRKAADALGGAVDDDVVLTGVAGVAETIAKRVKAAEDAGEVIEIL